MDDDDTPRMFSLDSDDDDSDSDVTANDAGTTSAVDEHQIQGADEHATEPDDDGGDSFEPFGDGDILDSIIVDVKSLGDIATAAAGGGGDRDTDMLKPPMEADTAELDVSDTDTIEYADDSVCDVNGSADGDNDRIDWNAEVEKTDIICKTEPEDEFIQIDKIMINDEFTQVDKIIPSNNAASEGINNHSVTSKCLLCDATFVTLATLTDHLLACNKCKAIKLDPYDISADCNQQSIKVLAETNSTVPLVKRVYYPCEYCDKRFNSKKALKRHLVKHPEAKVHWPTARNSKVPDKTEDYACDYCNKRYPCRSGLTRHMLKHPNVKWSGRARELFRPTKVVHIMPADAAAATASSLVLGRKRRRFPPRLPHTCPQCDNEQFVTLQMYKQHMASVHGVTVKRQRHECAHNGCQRTFRSRFGLQAHVNQQHSGGFEGQNQQDQNASQNLQTISEVQIPPSGCDGQTQQTTGDSKDKRYSCSMCSMTFKLRSDRTKHQRTHSENERPFVCEDCGLRCISKYGLCMHGIKMHGKPLAPKTFQCPICSNTIQFKNRQQHMSVHAKNMSRPYACDTCGKTFLSSARLASHVRWKHAGLGSPKPKNHVCQYCGKAFAWNMKLVDHVRIHTGEKPYVCETCGEAFRNKSILKAHMRSHQLGDSYQDGRFVCEHCGESFEWRNQWSRHMKTHVKKFPCQICNKMLTSFAFLAQHLHRHLLNGEIPAGREREFLSEEQLVMIEKRETMPKPHVCEYCGKSFREKAGLELHLRTHTGERPFKCDLCPQTYHNKVSLIHHKSRHRDEKNYKCAVCEKRFLRMQELKIHMFRHNQQGGYDCEWCGKKNGTKKRLETHQKGIRCQAKKQKKLGLI